MVQMRPRNDLAAAGAKAPAAFSLLKLQLNVGAAFA